MDNQTVFLKTWGTSRGGLSVDMDIFDKEGFFKKVDKWHEEIKENKYYGYPTWRYATVNGTATKNFKNMTIEEFEKIFNEDDIERLGNLLEYQGKNHGYSHYPVFLKAIYMKYGFEKEVTQ